MLYLEKNLAALQTRHPELAEAVRNFFVAGGVLPAPIPANETLQRECTRVAESIRAAKNPHLVCWLGLGQGDALLTYLQHPHRLMQRLLIIEPSLANFCAMLVRHDVAAVVGHASIDWFVGMARDAIAATLYQFVLQADDLHAGVPFSHFVDAQSDAAYAAVVRDMWHNIVREVAYQDSMIDIDAYVGFMNFTENFSTVLATPLIDDVRDVCAGLPGIVVSTGPSLAASYPWLRAVQDRAVLVCADSALRMLLANGIRPHFVATVERHQLTEIHFEGLDTRGITFVTTPIIHPGTYRFFTESCLHIGRESDFVQWIFPDAAPVRDIMDCVAHAGYFLLAQLGCSAIYLAGQDLAFDPDSGASHASGYSLATDRNAAAHGTEPMVPALANSGATIQTLILWSLWAQHLGLLIQKFGRPCCNVIAATHGIEIPHTTRLDPGDALMARFPEVVEVRARLAARVAQCTHTVLPARALRAHEIVAESVAGLRTLIAECHAMLDRIGQIVAQVSPNRRDDEANAVYQQLFAGVQQCTDALSARPFYRDVLGAMVHARHIKLARESLAMLADADPVRMRRRQLLVPLGWYAEILVRAEMMQERLQGVAGDRSPVAG